MPRKTETPALVNDAQIKAAKQVGRWQKEYPVKDSPGLFLRVSPVGVKSWTLRYRNVAGQQRRLTLGSYPDVTLAVAREKAAKRRAEIGDRIDPAQIKKVERVEAKARRVSTVSQLIERYLVETSKGRHRPNAQPKRQSTMTLE